MAASKAYKLITDLRATEYPHLALAVRETLGGAERATLHLGSTGNELVLRIWINGKEFCEPVYGEYTPAGCEWALGSKFLNSLPAGLRFLIEWDLLGNAHKDLRAELRRRQRKEEAAAERQLTLA